MLTYLVPLAAAVIILAAAIEEIRWHRAYSRRAAMRRRIAEYSAR